jgi:hypothetical protein
MILSRLAEWIVPMLAWLALASVSRFQAHHDGMRVGV